MTSTREMAQRFEALCADLLDLVFELCNGKMWEQVDLVPVAPERLGVSLEEVQNAMSFLYRRGFLECYAAIACVSITERGISAVLESNRPRPAHREVNSHNIVNVTGDGNVVLGSGSALSATSVDEEVDDEEPRPMWHFPTPPGAGWHDTAIRFLDPERVSIKIANAQARVYNFTQMGMVDSRNAKPDEQWKLLDAFADGHGTLDWSNEDAARENQKRREKLGKVLQAFFGIEDDPFTYRKDAKGWQAKFVIEPKE